MAAPTPEPSEPPPLRVQAIASCAEGRQSRAVELSWTITVVRGRMSARCASQHAGMHDRTVVLAHQVSSRWIRAWRRRGTLRAAAPRRAPEPRRGQPRQRLADDADSVSRSSHWAATSSG